MSSLMSGLGMGGGSEGASGGMGTSDVNRSGGSVATGQFQASQMADPSASIASSSGGSGMNWGKLAEGLKSMSFADKSQGPAGGDPLRPGSMGEGLKGQNEQIYRPPGILTMSDLLEKGGRQSKKFSPVGRG